ncbi:alpha-1-antitrypsin-like [Nothoprocta perdicaria]|uniref:alpha-1-antitrypsin-like n=1 Tax=Nothoprocta perdicaria TaxID=30464 RepID=UPI000E1B663E|nr:alpha-1-antitrypsin-like [Nothoprocta perdicaria]
MKIIFCTCLLLVGLHAVSPIQLTSKHDRHDPNESQHSTLHKGEVMSCLKLVPNNADFAFQFFKEINLETPNKNIFFSPVSISNVFAMLAFGAKSSTQTQILEGLAFNLTEMHEKEIHEGFHHLIHMLSHPESEVYLDMSSMIFLPKMHKPLKKFLDDVKALYQMDALSVDFSNPAEAEEQINNYVERKTNGKITCLVKDIDPQTVMLLASFTFFKGKWQTPFQPELTEEREFFVDEETTVKIPMMHQTNRFDFYFDETIPCTIVRLHYNGSATVFLVLPEKGKMKNLEQTLDKETVLKWSENLSQRSISLYFPKFSLSANYDIKHTLNKMGIIDVFTNQADLSGITGTPGLKVSKVVHKTALEVDEEGTETAEVTFAEAAVSFAGIMPFYFPQIIEFNRPFILLIFDRATNSTLFIGKIVNPAKH